MTTTTFDCPVPGVVLTEQTRKSTLPFDPHGTQAARDVITERLYRCANGLQLGARRGGRLHLADGNTWEIFTLDAKGIAIGQSSGFVSEEVLNRAVRRLASWFDTDLVAWSEAVPA